MAQLNDLLVLGNTNLLGTVTATTFSGNATTATRATTAATADKVANQLIIGNQVFDGATEITVTAKDLGLTGAMIYKGVSTSAISDSGTQAPTIGGSPVATSDLQAGNVVLYDNKEFVWNGNNWELLGDEGSYKVKQTAVADPSADGYEVSFIDSLSQDANGKITATKKTVVSASTTTNGLMTADMVTKLSGIATGANKYSLPLASSSTRGGVKIGYTQSGKNYPVQLSNEQMYVNVPWTDTTYGAAGTSLGLVKSGGDVTIADGVITVNNDSHTHSNYVPLAGGTMTGNLFIQGENPYVGFKNSSGTTKGYVQYIQSSDSYAIGAGSANSLVINSTGSITIPEGQTFTPITTNTGTIGTSDKKWNAMYATTFNGNATSATKATQDGDGKTISSTYLKLTGGTLTGNLSILTGDTDKFIIWDYSTSDNSKGASWRIGELGTGSSNENYFVIQTTGSATGTTETYANAMRIGMNNKDVTFYGDVTSSKFIGDLQGNASTATTLQTARTINGMTFNGSANITNYGVCSTAEATAEKAVTVNSTFVLAEGAQVIVKFTQKNSAASPKLNVNGTGAKPIMQYGTTAASTTTSTTGWIAGAVQTFTYDGTNWVRDYWYNTTYSTRPISQTVTTTDAEYPLLSRTTTEVTTGNGHARFAAGVTLNPSTNTITATTFKGNATSASKLQTARTITLTGSVTGSGSFDGSDNLSITTTTNHDHDSTYVNITGDTMTGALNFQNNILNKVGDDSSFGDQDKAGHFIIQGLNGTTALGFKEYGATNIASIYSNGTKIWTGTNALLPCWSTLTGGNANVAGWRLIGSHALGTWHNNRANFIINSRHTGNGLLSIAYGCNSSTIDATTVYCDVVISGNNSGAGSIWNSNAFKCYYNSTNNYLYFFWYYTDYNSTDIISFGSPISDFYPEDGTWVETIDAATYGVEITTLRRSWNQGDAVTGAVWNDYAECRESDCEEFGYVLMEIGDDSLTKTTERLSHFAGVSSDTWGFSQGETDKAKTPIAVAGRVLVYTYQDRNNYKPGDCVCAAPGGTVDIMTREEVINWPDRIVGTVSCVPEYDEWGGGKNADRDPVKVNGRIWIKIR